MKLTGFFLAAIFLSYVPAALSQNGAPDLSIAQASTGGAGMRYVTSDWNWLQHPSDDLTTPGKVTIHLSPCPLGLDTNSSANYYTYKVYISGTGTPEAVGVSGGSCAPGTSGGTITVR